MKTSDIKNTMLLDALFGLLLMPLMILLGPACRWLQEWPLFFVLVCLFLYGCYWLVRRIDVPGMFMRRRYGRIAAVMAALICSNYALSFYPLPQMDFVTPSMSEYQTSVRNYGVALSLWLMFVAVMGFALTVSFITELYRQTLLRKDLENQRDKAELAIFKAQISPHFLFNTLNSLYSLVIGTSQKAEDAFIKFADLLKYTYTTIENEEVPIGGEIEYIQNYIDLQSIRLNRHTRVDWSYDIDDMRRSVPPMIFLTLVENAFKYGASTTADCDIVLRMKLKCGMLSFSTRNRIMKHGDTFRSEMPVGMANCRARLDGLFPGRNTLETREVDGMFELDMNIQLN